jgi:tRNA pseudouridine55 synthase
MWACTVTISMTTAAEIEGVLPIDKPVGPTSHDIVGIARRSLHTRRIGHTGTLDPFASGLLLLCVGRATRIAEYLTGMPKRYRAVMRLGTVTDTDDGTGAILATQDPASITTAQVEDALAAQRGDILQTPPPYSAKKRDGVRAYELARAGNAVHLEPVPVTVHELALLRHDGADVELDVMASSGTYIRAIARDVGAALGVGAHLVSLRRTAIGTYRVEDALPLEALDDAERVRTALVAPADALPGFGRLDLGEAEVVEIRHGRPVRAAVPDGMLVLTHDGELAALGIAAGGVVRPKKVFL